ncbi:MAG: serine/threonine-protein kinase [Chloroflexota bacterium]
MPLSPGQILNNRYRVVKLLGQGGFGAVYRAWDTNLDEPIALKESFETSPAAQRQFQLEAKLLFKLHHNNLPRVHDFFTIPGQGMYLVMDYIEGEDLETMLKKAGGPLPEAQALQWIGQVCEALAYLHSQTPPIIHRDIKPANIKITPQGKAMLVDFGIAKVYDPSLSTTAAARAVTPGYSPQEQYGMGTTDARTDVYALGATLYHLLTGVQPPESIQRNIDPNLMRPPRSLNPALSPHIETAVQTAMSAHPSQRYSSAAAFKNALTAAQAPSTATISPGVSTTVSVPYQAQVKMPAQASAIPWRWLVVGMGMLFIVGMFVIAMAVWSLLPKDGEGDSGGAVLTSAARTAAWRTELAVRASDTPMPGSNIPTETQARPRPTDTVVIRPTNTIRILEPTDTPYVAPTATYTQRAPEPDEFIREYYGAINQRQYELAWSMLTENFKDRYNASGFGPYEDWWDTVERIDVLEENIQEQSSTRSVIAVKLRFTYKTGKVVDDNSVYELVKYPWSYGWKIESYWG